MIISGLSAGYSQVLQFRCSLIVLIQDYYSKHFDLPVYVKQEIIRCRQMKSTNYASRRFQVRVLKRKFRQQTLNLIHSWSWTNTTNICRLSRTFKLMLEDAFLSIKDSRIQVKRKARSRKIGAGPLGICWRLMSHCSYNCCRYPNSWKV